MVAVRVCRGVLDALPLTCMAGGTGKPWSHPLKALVEPGGNLIESEGLRGFHWPKEAGFPSHFMLTLEFVSSPGFTPQALYPELGVSSP